MAWADITGAVTVIDGDTIEIAGQRIRLHGIDAPESEQRCYRADAEAWPCGSVATLMISFLVAEKIIRCECHDDDSSAASPALGQRIAICRAGDMDLGGAMVHYGLALADRRTSDRYVAFEAAAEAAGRGIWAGRFEPPWVWRALRAN